MGDEYFRLTDKRETCKNEINKERKVQQQPEKHGVHCREQKKLKHSSSEDLYRLQGMKITLFRV